MKYDVTIYDECDEIICVKSVELTEHEYKLWTDENYYIINEEEADKINDKIVNQLDLLNLEKKLNKKLYYNFQL